MRGKKSVSRSPARHRQGNEHEATVPDGGEDADLPTAGLSDEQFIDWAYQHFDFIAGQRRDTALAMRNVGLRPYQKGGEADRWILMMRKGYYLPRDASDGSPEVQAERASEPEEGTKTPGRHRPRSSSRCLDG